MIFSGGDYIVVRGIVIGLSGYSAATTQGMTTVAAMTAAATMPRADAFLIGVSSCFALPLTCGLVFKNTRKTGSTGRRNSPAGPS